MKQKQRQDRHLLSYLEEMRMRQPYFSFFQAQLMINSRLCLRRPHALQRGREEGIHQMLASCSDSTLFALPEKGRGKLFALDLHCLLPNPSPIFSPFYRGNHPPTSSPSFGRRHNNAETAH